MSHFEDKLDLLKKKDNFFNEICDKFSKDELSEYRKLCSKIWGIKFKIWELSERSREIGLENQKSEKEIKVLTKGFFVFVFLISIIQYFTKQSTLDYVFTTIGAGLIFSLLQINQRINFSVSINEIKNTKLTITQLEALLCEVNLIHLPDMTSYMKIYEKKRYSSDSLSDEEKYILSEFNVERNLAIAESMGYSQPTFWY